MNTPLISVIVPCYNQAQYLDECLQSVLEQSYPHWECIIVNDGSPDNTEDIALAWTKKDSCFRYNKAWILKNLYNQFLENSYLDSIEINKNSIKHYKEHPLKSEKTCIAIGSNPPICVF